MVSMHYLEETVIVEGSMRSQLIAKSTNFHAFSPFFYKVQNK